MFNAHATQGRKKQKKNHEKKKKTCLVRNEGVADAHTKHFQFEYARKSAKETCYQTEHKALSTESYQSGKLRERL